MTDYTQLGVAGAVVVVVYFFLKFIKEESDRRTKTEGRMSAAIEKMADPKQNGNERIAKATENSAKESAQRNGHLAELGIENTKSLMEAIAAFKNQPIREQKVEHQTIKETHKE